MVVESGVFKEDKMNNELKEECVIIGLKKLFTDSFFSMCTLDKLTSATGIQISTNDRNCLSLLHCVNYGDMKKEVRQSLFELILGYLILPEYKGFDTKAIELLEFNGIFKVPEKYVEEKNSFSKKIKSLLTKE